MDTKPGNTPPQTTPVPPAGPRGLTPEQLAKIYPSVQPQTPPPQAPTSNRTADQIKPVPAEETEYKPRGRIAKRVPAVKHLAVLILVISIVTIATSAFFILQLNIFTGTPLWQNSFLLFLFLTAAGLAAIPMLLGVVLLATKSKTLASALITVLIMLWVLGIISSLTRPGVRTITTLIFNGVLIAKALDAKEGIKALM